MAGSSDGAALSLFARIRDGRALRAARRRLHDAKRYGHGPAAVAVAEFAVALYSPLPEETP